jgi:hemerythrin-like domain-containing protein
MEVNMLIYNLLQNDHQVVLDAIDAIEKVNNPDRREDLFDFMRTELLIHSKAEEEVFYRPLCARVNKEDKELIDGSYDDHERVENLLSDIKGTSTRSDRWLDMVLDLREALEDHIDKEEGELFSIAREVFSTDEAEDIAIRMMERKGWLAMENPIALFSLKFKEMGHKYNR